MNDRRAKMMILKWQAKADRGIYVEAGLARSSAHEMSSSNTDSVTHCLHQMDLTHIDMKEVGSPEANFAGMDSKGHE